MWEGRDLERKRRIARDLTGALVAIIDCDPQTVRVLINDYSKEDWGVGGTLQFDIEQGARSTTESPDG
jgi:4-oxalocrotonate tautomerase